MFPPCFDALCSTLCLCVSFTNNLNQYALWPTAIKFAVEDLFPGTEIEFTVGDGDHDFPSHDLPFVVSVGVVFACAIMFVFLRRWIEGSQFSSHFL